MRARPGQQDSNEDATGARGEAGQPQAKGSQPRRGMKAQQLPPPPGIPEGTGTRMQSKEGAVNRQRYEGCPDSGAGAGARERVAGRLGKQHTHKKSKRAAEGSKAGTQEDPPPYCWDLAQPTTARRGERRVLKGVPRLFSSARSEGSRKRPGNRQISKKDSRAVSGGFAGNGVRIDA